jgi:hypothetical protein
VVVVDHRDDRDEWLRLVHELPWPDHPRVAPQPDRFVYRIRVSRRQITLAEQQLAGPWRELVDRVRDAAETDREAT